MSTIDRNNPSAIERRMFPSMFPGEQQATAKPTAKPEPKPKTESSPKPPDLSRRLFPSMFRDEPQKPKAEAKKPDVLGQDVTPKAKPPEPKAPPPEAEAKAPEQAQDDAETFDESAYDGATISSYRGVAEDLGVDAGVAQRLLERMAPAIAERQQEQLAELSETWAQESRAKFSDQDIKAARALVTEHGDDELRDFLGRSPLGSHPGLIGMLSRVGRRLQAAEARR